MERIASIVETNSVRQISSRERILDGAEKLLAERGYAAASISLIAKTSGLPASSIYWHFDSKENLLAAVVERGARRWLDSQPRWHSFKGDFAAFLRAIQKATEAQPPFLRILMMLILDHSSTSPRVRRTMSNVWLDVLTRIQHILAEHFRLGSDARGHEIAERMARFILALADGAFVDSYIDPDGVATEKLFVDLAIALETLATSLVTKM